MNKLLVCAALGLALAVTEIRYVHTAKSYSESAALCTPDSSDVGVVAADIPLPAH